VSGGVEDGEERGRVVDGVVEGVSADVVAGFQDGGDHHAVGGERERGQQPPHQLRRLRHPPGPLGRDQRVPVRGLGGEQVTDQLGEQVTARPEPLAVDIDCRVAHGVLEDAETFDAVQQRHPQRDRLARANGDRLGMHERLPGDTGVDGLRLRRILTPLGYRAQCALLVIDHPYGDLHPEPGYGRVDHSRELVRLREPIADHQVDQRMLPLCRRCFGSSHTASSGTRRVRHPGSG
jgi:hypothetical protein